MKQINNRVVYYFGLGDLLKDLGLSQVEARKKFGFDQPGPGYISKTGFQKLCNKPRQITIDILNVICNQMKVTPVELWKMES